MNENLLDHRLQNRNIKKSLADSITEMFPIKQGSRELSITNINVEDTLSETDFPAQKETKLRRKNWEMPITANIEIFDTDLNKVVSKKENVKIGAIPKITNRFSTIIKGNEYQVTNQIRRKSGVYSRVRKNGELESEFNLQKGANFSIEIDPQKQIFYLTLSSSNRRYRLYNVLDALGVSDAELEKAWGSNLVDINKKGALNVQESELKDIYRKVTKKDWDGPLLKLKKALKDYFSTTKMSSEVTKITLGSAYDSASPESMIAAAQKLVKINKGEQEPDDRDSLIFKNIYTPDDLLKEYFKGHAAPLQKKLSNALRVREDVREIIPANTFSKPIESFFTTSDLSSTPPQTNPVAMAVNSRKTTPMGEGGIQNSHSITMETRDVHPSQIGFLDPLSTPECYVPDTEVFTSEGWKKITEVKESTLVAIKDGGNLDFSFPEKIVSYPFEGDVINVDSKRVSISVTPEHRMYVKPLGGKQYRIETAEKSFGKPRNYYVKPGAYKGEGVDLLPDFIKGNINNESDWFEFIGWFVSEGTAYTDGDYSRISISQCSIANPEKYEILKNLIYRLPFNFYRYETHFSEYKTPELHRFMQQFGHTAPNKFIGDEYLKTSIKNRTALLRGLLYGDGRRVDPRTKNKCDFDQDVYTTSSPELADFVERLVISLGYYCSHNFYADNRNEAFKDIHEIRIMNSEEIQITSQGGHYSKEYYSGDVHCLTVPGGLVYVRKDGKNPVWCGNSDKVGVTVGLTSEVQKIDGVMKIPVIMPNGEKAFKSTMEMYESVVGLPDQFKLVNGKPVPHKDIVKVMNRHKPGKVNKSEVDFYIKSPNTLFDFTPNLMPWLQTTQANRASTGSRMITQALPIDNPDTPLSVVQRDEAREGDKGNTYEDLMGSYLLPTLERETGDREMGGTVTSVENEYVNIKGDDGKDYKIGMYKDFPLNEDGFLNTEPVVKEGQRIEGDELLAKSNYTDKEGRLAMGKNLTVGYISYKGNSFEDAATITESAAKKLTHTSVDRLNVFFHPKSSVFNLKKFRATFPEDISPANARKLDSEGLPKIGETFDPGETLVAFLVKKEADDLDMALKKLNKATYSPYSRSVLEWDEADPGVVTEVRKVGRNIDVYVKSVHPFKEGDKLCVDEETEFLTKDGWKPLLTLTGTEEFCTLNPSNHNIEYQKADALNIYDHEGPMYCASNAAIDQKVTLNHRMYVKRRNPVGSDYGLYSAKDIVGKRVRYLKSGIWVGKELKVPVELDHEINPEDFSRFMGWFLSEGNTSKTNKGYVTSIHQSKKINPKNYKEIKILIQNMGLTPICQKDRILFNSKSFYYYLATFGKSYEKYIPSCIKNSTSDIIETFLDAYCKGDGTITKSGQRIYITASLKMRDDLMEIILKSGRAANYTLGSPKGSPVFKYFSNYDCWNIREIKTKLSPEFNHGHNKKQNVQVEEIDEYSGKVGCPTTQNGVVYIRRNGKTSWTGNSSRYGDKHIIGKIIPDDEAPHRPDGTPIDIMVNPQGVQGRMNMGQMLDTTAGKIALKKGEPFVTKNFSNPDGDDAKDLYEKLKAEGIEANEILTDGKNGEPIENPVFVGNRQYMKLRHLVKKKNASHSYGVYDIDEQPAGKGAQRMDVLSTYAHMAHGANNLLRESSERKGRKNDEYFRNLQFGLPPSKPNSNLMFDKLINYVKASGADVKKDGHRLQLTSMTDDKIEAVSKGEIPDPGAMLIGKNLGSRKGGLFDPEITGGQRGENYSHIDLPSRLPNPMAETAIKSILGLTNKKFDAVMKGSDELDGKKGPEAIVGALSAIDVSKELKKTKDELNSAPESSVNKLNLKARVLKNLDQEGLTADKAFTNQKFLLIPPKFRPVYPLPSGDLQVSDINKHYRDVGLKVRGLKTAKEQNLLTPEEETRYESNLYDTIKSSQGFTDPQTYGKQKYKGALKDLGDLKKGLIFGKAWSKRQDLSGRSTITPEPSLGLDDVGIPEDMAYDIFEPFTVRKLKQSGMTAMKAKKEVKDRTKLSRTTLEQVMREKPVVLNRAPSLHKHSVQAFKPSLTSGKEIRLNPMVVSGYGADFDGDQQINSVVIFLLDKDLENYYISHSQYNKQFWRNREIMASRLDVKLPYVKDGKYYMVNLEDFPYKKDQLLGKKDHIDFYEAEEHINVVSYDEVNKKLVLAKASGWSYHKQREIWTVDLSDKTQIITDDDPRAIYGIDPNTLKMVRSTPSNAKKLLVPKSDFATKLDSGMKKLSVPGVGKLKQDITLSKEVGYVLGSLVGDGWVDVVKGTPKTVNLAGIEQNCFKKYKESLLHIFKEEPHIGHTIMKKSYGKSEKRIISSVDFASWVLPLIGKGAKNKHLPPFWFTATDEFKWGLFSGLLDTDGSVSVSRSKKKPQMLVNISSISIRLLQETQQLLRTLGIRSRISFSKKTQSDNDFWILSISAPNLSKQRDKLFTAHEKNIEALGTFVDQNSKSAMRNDYVPFNAEIKKYVNSTTPGFYKTHKGIYESMNQASKVGYITRFTAKQILDLEGVSVSKLPKEWVDIVKNEDVTWVHIKKVENTGKKEDGYDLTVPGYETFLSVDGIVLSNTMSVMVPVTYEGEQEARSIMPSRILFKHGDHGLVPSLSQEYIFGVSKISEFGRETGKSFNSIEEAKKAKLRMTDVFKLNGKKMTIGQWELNKTLPEEYRDYSRTFKRKDLPKLLTKIAKEQDSKVFAEVIDNFKNLGASYSYKYGGTLSIDDMVIDRSYRDDLINKYEGRIEKLKDPNKKVKAYNELVAKIEDAQNKSLAGKNRMLDLIDTGALSATKAGNVRQVLSAPGIVTDTQGRSLPLPILRSYSEGLDTFDYTNTYSGVRKGTVDKSVNTRESGALNKILLSATRRLLVTEEDCGTSDGRKFSIDDKNVMDRTLTHTVPGVGQRNTLVDSSVILKAREKDIKELSVRSPLSCESVQGVCQKCYGALPDGKLAKVGTNVGLLEAEALTERSTQLTMQTFHTGGAAKKGGTDIQGSFPRILELVKVPEKLSGKATLSSKDGKVESVEQNEIGGYDVKVGGTNFIIGPGRTPVVEKGNNVKKGDRLSDGKIKPQELAEFKDFASAQDYIVDEISDVYGGDFFRKNMETVVRGISDNAEITYAPEDSGLLRGDKKSTSYIKSVNRERASQDLEPIGFKPYFKSVDTLNVDNEDWGTRITTNRIKDGLAKGMARGDWANLAGRDPVLPFLYGDDFGKPERKIKDGSKGFY